MEDSIDQNVSNRSERSLAQHVFIRRDDEQDAMAWDDRARNRVKNFFRRSSKREAPPAERKTGQDVDHEEGAAAAATSGNEDSNKPKQYRLEAARRPKQRSLVMKLITCCGLLGPSRRDGRLSVGINANQKLAMYMHWIFRVNFFFIFGVMCLAFFGLVVLFTGFIAAAGNGDPQCVRIGEYEFDHFDTGFADAFALSWTSLSTVGYGSTYPALAHENDNKSNCFLVNFICSLEALVGILYSGFCGAILFGKVLRIQSHAQVLFSDPLVIRYGSGISDLSDEDGADNKEADEGDAEKNQNPCPVLEFRIINRLFNETGGEIMDAALNVVANVDANDADPSLREALESDRSHMYDNDKRRQADSVTNSDSGSVTESGLFAAAATDTGRSLRKVLDSVQHLHRRREHRQVDEDPTARLVSKHIFSKLIIEASDHPFFKRVWLARHVLDGQSPLLKPRVRRQIRRNGGYWPDRLNNYTSIRDSLRFNQILVSLNGVSNVSASDVYAQKIYDFVDINIGYQFVNILYRDTDGSLGLDMDLINDVREQTGDDPGEPLIIED